MKLMLTNLLLQVMQLLLLLPLLAKFARDKGKFGVFLQRQVCKIAGRGENSKKWRIFSHTKLSPLLLTKMKKVEFPNEKGCLFDKRDLGY